MKYSGRAVRWWFVAALFLSVSVAQAGRVVSVTLCKGVVKPDLIPVDIQERFAPDTPVIHALIVIEDVRLGAKLKGEWVSVDAISTPNYVIDTAELAAQGANTTAHLSISRPNRGWPPGNYRLNFYIDGKLATVKTFKVIAEAGAQSSAPALERESQPAPVLPRRQPEMAPPPLPQESVGGFSGTYVLQSERATITLVLRQASDGSIKGTLSSTTGIQFQLEGMLKEDEAVGVCSSNEGKVFFEASLEGNQLHLALIEPDANNMPTTSAHDSWFSRARAARVSPLRPRSRRQSRVPRHLPAHSVRGPHRVDWEGDHQAKKSAIPVGASDSFCPLVGK